MVDDLLTMLAKYWISVRVYCRGWYGGCIL